MIEDWFSHDNVSASMVGDKLGHDYINGICILAQCCDCVCLFTKTKYYNDIVTLSCDHLLQLVHKRLASQCLGLLIDVEEQSFEKRLDTFLPLLSSCLVTTSTTDCGSRLPEIEQSDNESWSVVSEDHLLYNTLSTLKKVFNTCMVAMETSDHTPIILSKYNVLALAVCACHITQLMHLSCVIVFSQNTNLFSWHNYEHSAYPGMCVQEVEKIL